MLVAIVEVLDVAPAYALHGLGSAFIALGRNFKAAVRLSNKDVAQRPPLI